MKIGILGAMLPEVELIKELMIVHEIMIIANREYFIGHIGHHEIVLTFSRWGKVASASTTTTLINTFNVDFIIFTGVAGAVDQKLNIGDIIVGSGFYQHDMDARPFFDQFQIPLTEQIIFEPHADILSKALFASKKFLNKIETEIPCEKLNKHAISKPLVYEGLIASGDKFIADPSLHIDLQYTKGDKHTLAVEMEGAAVAQVCAEHKIPYVVFRTISDKADHSAIIDFQEFVDQIASHYSAGIIREFLDILGQNL